MTAMLQQMQQRQNETDAKMEQATREFAEVAKATQARLDNVVANNAVAIDDVRATTMALQNNVTALSEQVKGMSDTLALILARLPTPAQ